jgi:signal peptidase I
MSRRILSGKDQIISPVFTVLSLAMILTLVRLFILEVMRVEGHSMEPTLSPSQLIFINRLSYGIILPFIDRYLLMWSTPQIGDVVVLRNRTDGKTLIKRCIAKEGDPIQYKDGCLILGSAAELISPPIPAEILRYREVPKGQIVVLGDNRSNSVDSRALVDRNRQGERNQKD